MMPKSEVQSLIPELWCPQFKLVKEGLLLRSSPFVNAAREVVLCPLAYRRCVRNLYSLRRRSGILFVIPGARNGVGSEMVAILDAGANRLLAALPDAELQRWLPQLEHVDLPLGHVLYESGVTLSHVYFPTTAIVSLLYVLENGASAEIAVVGKEGIVGISLFMGGESTPNRAVVQSAGRGFRLSADALKAEFNRAGTVLHLLLRYTQALITQMSQTAVCNRHHSLDQQLCRWLLLSLDRLAGHELVMTQELISNMLGVRREGVTEAAQQLQAAGLIRYARGRITVLDRDRLEQRSCECYAVVKKEYDRLLPDARAK
jgi:CRP-like cAMP-binding protein